jgi:hypothetical protein
VSLAASQHTITIDYRSESSGNTARIRNARVVAIRKASLEMASAAVDSQQALTGTMTDYATLNWTPGSAGDYLLIYTAEFSAGTSYSTTVQARLNGSPLDEAVVEAKDATDYVSFACFAAAACAASQQTISIAASREGSGTYYIRRCRLAAIRLTGGRFAGYASAESVGQSQTSSTSFQEKLTRSWSVSSAGDWLVVAGATITESSTLRSVEARVQLDDSETLAQQLREPQDTTGWLTFGCVAVRNLSAGTRKVDIDYRTENSGYTARIKNARLVALPLQ